MTVTIPHEPRKVADITERRRPKPRQLVGGFTIDENHATRPGVYFTPTDADGRPGSPQWICSPPLYVRAFTRSESGEDWGRLLEWKDHDGRNHTWAMPCEMLAPNSGEGLRSVLWRGGLEITNDAAGRRRLVDYITGQRPSVIARAVSRTGWHGSAFVYPGRSEGGSDEEPIYYQSQSAEGLKLATAGTLAAWREKVAAPLAGNSRPVFAVSVAFAAPVLGLLELDGGGLHLRGDSSSGKSTALRLAASVWGSSDFVRTWRNTDNGLEGVAALHSDLPLLLDELAELPPKDAGRVAYMLANGQGKGRAHRDGTARVPARWRVLFLSTGEVGLGDLIAEAGGRSMAGQEVRIADIPADAGAGLGVFDRVPEGSKAAGFAERLRDVAARLYGHAGPAFVAELVREHARHRLGLRESMDRIAGVIAPHGASGQVHRVAQRFALVAVAGELATEKGLTGWPTGEATRAAAACFRAWLSARGTTGPAEPAAMIAHVRRFLEAHGQARFTPWTDPERPTSNRAGFRRDALDGSGAEFYILPEVFKSEVCRGFDHRAVARALASVGALSREADKLTRKERIPGLGNTAVYRITPAIWSDHHE